MNLPFALLLALVLGLMVSFGLLALLESRRRARALDAISRVERALRISPDLGAMLKPALDAVLEITHAAAASVWLVNPDKHILLLRVHRGLFPDSVAESELAASVAAPARQCFESGKILHLTALDKFPSLSAKGFVDYVSVPLALEQRIIGVLDIGARHKGELTTPTLEWLGALGPPFALAISSSQQLAEANARKDAARRLWQVGVDVASEQDYAQLLRTVVDRARELIGGEASALCLWDEQKRWMVVQGTSGLTDAFEVSMKRFARENGATAECPVVRFKYRRAHLDVPLVREGRIVGCLCIANQHERNFSEGERALLAGVADQAALAVDRMQQLQAAGNRAAVTERERLAREMHDTLAQLLGFVNLKTLTIRELLEQGQVSAAQVQVEQIGTLSQELYADTRELILGLRTATGPHQGLIAALREYIERFSELSGVNTTLHVEGLEDVRFVPAVEVQLIRVVQEALSNVRKHAQAHHAQVALARVSDAARIQIQDDGQGFDPANLTRGLWPRFGLQSMRERVESLGGSFSVHSIHGQGTTIAVQVPLLYRGVGDGDSRAAGG